MGDAGEGGARQLPIDVLGKDAIIAGGHRVSWRCCKNRARCTYVCSEATHLQESKLLQLGLLLGLELCVQRILQILIVSSVEDGETKWHKSSK